MSSSPIMADLLSLHWAVESMANLKQKKIIFEYSSLSLRDTLANPNSLPEFCGLVDAVHALLQKLESWCLRLAPSSENKAAMEIAVSVTRDMRLHSYVARGGPSWLRSLLSKEAATWFSPPLQLLMSSVFSFLSVKSFSASQNYVWTSVSLQRWMNWFSVKKKDELIICANRRNRLWFKIHITYNTLIWYCIHNFLIWIELDILCKSSSFIFLTSLKYLFANFNLLF